MADSSAVLSATNLTVRYGLHIVLDGVTVAIHEGERVGVVGRNGTGKSTFLRIAAGAVEPDAGIMTRRRDLITGYLPQVFDLADDQTVNANILEGARRVLDLIHQYENLPSDSTQSADILEKINHLDGWNIEHRIKSLSTHLGAPDADRLVGNLSGGEKRRVALCRALVAQPDLIILDEPTNHLDTESIEWLETFLQRYPGTCAFVTHDRYFLDRIATRIIEFSAGGVFSHPGNYTAYLEAKADRQATEELQDARRKKFLSRELEWIRRGPRARRTKSVDRIERFHQLAGQAERERELDVDLLIPPAPRLANKVIELREVGVELGGRTLFSGLNFSLEAGSRVGIVGRNGLGKTTLLRVILGQLTPTWGEVEIGARTQINYVDQGRLELDDNKTVFDEVGEGSEHVRLGEESITLRAYLRRFLFTDDRINTKIEHLSGGERSRVVLAKILRRGGNVLVLDEPTNDLDLATLRVLEEGLCAFDGSVIVVSHDRYFLNRVCTSILAFEGNGRLFQNTGDYDYYLEKRGPRMAAAAAAPAAVAAPSPAPVAATPGAARKLKWKEVRELETIEQTILEAENEVTRLEAQFADVDFQIENGARWREVEATLDAARRKVASLYTRWEELEKLRPAS